MQRVLIVDDDRLILEDICKLIRWESYGFQEPIVAESARQALEILDNMNIDLVITDISMPEISGVELIRQAKPRFPDTIFAVLSNYDDFVYVKEAMKSGAVEYLLKYEIEAENLRAFLAQMRKKIQSEKQSLKDRERLIQMQQAARHDLKAHFWRQLYYGYPDAQQMYEQAARLEIPIKGGAWVPVLAEFSPLNEQQRISMVWQEVEAAAAKLSENIELFGTMVGERLLFLAVFIPEVSFLILTAKLSQVLRTLKDRFEYADITAFLCSGKICMQLKGLPESIKGMKEHEYLRFYQGFGVSRMEIPEFIVKGKFPIYEWNKILTDMVTGSPEELDKGLEAFRSEVLHEQPEEAFLKQKMIQDMQGKLRNTEEAGSWEEQMRNAPTFTQTFLLLKKLVIECSRVNMVLEKIGRREIRETVIFLYQHYAEAVSLNQLADLAGMSRAYFCKVFKDETGKNYTDFVNHIRIEYAKQMLCRDNLNTSEIAYRIGFSDYRYFCRLFKNLTGKTCSEYRKLCGEEIK